MFDLEQAWQIIWAFFLRPPLLLAKWLAGLLARLRGGGKAPTGRVHVRQGDDTGNGA